MTELFAQPYNRDARGFFFNSFDDYQEKAETLRDRFGNVVEEFEILFIDGEEIDGELFAAMGVTQATLELFFEKADEWDEEEKTRVIVAANGGYIIEADSNPYDFDVDIYEVDTLRELAIQFVDEGEYGDIPEQLQYYIDYDAIARDLGVNYSETTIAGKRIVYRCG
ncbi:MAG: antirestriction protein ArdA [Ignavibacteriae bacterium]|nr:antirestriction protein ArdA [Ignavibacteriota bacterium]MCB9217162.1 antirestriction protein ArdA [Ignavibacteria bacterium]